MQPQPRWDAPCVAAVQWARQPFSSRSRVNPAQALERAASALEAPLAEAARAGARLVALPWGPDGAAKSLGGMPEGSETVAAFEALGKRLASTFGVALAAGPVPVETPAGVRWVAYIFGPDGRVLGTQVQTHRGDAERRAGVVAGADLVPIETAAGLVGLVSGADVDYPEVSRILCLQGARILVCLGALPHWSEALALSRLWREVQANQVFGVEAYAVGAGYRGRSAIHAPVEMTPGQTGWLARAADDEHPAVVVANLDFGQLHRVREAYPIDRLRNERQYRRYFPWVYGAGAVREAPPETGEVPRGAKAAPDGQGPLGGSAPHEVGQRERGGVPGPMALASGALGALLWPWMLLRSRSGLVRTVLDGLPYPRAAKPELPKVRVAVVQFDINLTFSAAAYARHAYEMVRRAVEGGAGLVIFPEYATLPLLGLLPGAARLAAMLEGEAEQAKAEPAHAAAEGSYGTMAVALRLAAPAARRVHQATFSALAARFGVTLVAGSAIELGADGRLYNVGYLYGPDGSEHLRQPKTHLVPSEVEMGYGVGQEILVADTQAGRLALPVCMDHTYFETARIASLLGAALLIDPSANNEYYNPYAQARGVWNRVQEVRTYGVLCSGVGRVAGSVFQGRSGVYAPLGMTPAGDGVLAEAQTCDREEIVFADLDYAALDAYRAREPLEFNLELYRRYLPVAYNLRGL